MARRRAAQSIMSDGARVRLLADNRGFTFTVQLMTLSDVIARRRRRLYITGNGPSNVHSAEYRQIKRRRLE